MSKLFWAFWCSTTGLTGIVAGFMLSHALLLGRFFSWFVASDKMDLLRQTYPIFEETSQPDPNLLYYIPFLLVIFSGIAWTIVAFILKRDRIIALFAGLSTFWVAGLYFVSGMAAAEQAVLSGLADNRMAGLFLAINVPVHLIFSAIYIVSLFLLLFVALKEFWNKSDLAEANQDMVSPQ